MSWSEFFLDDVASVFNGKTPSKLEQRGEGYPVLKIKDVSENGKFKGIFESFVDVELANKSKSKLIQFKDTLILNAAHNADYVGSKQYCAEYEVVSSLPTGEWLIVRGKHNKVNSVYLNFWFRLESTKFNIRNMVKGIHLYPKDVARLKIPVPPLAEQQKIAAILDAADSLRQKDQQLVERYTALSQSLFLEMFGELEYLTIEELISDKVILVHKDGNFGGMYPRKNEFGDDGIPFLSAKHIDENGNFMLDDVPLLNKGKAAKLTFGWITKDDVLLSHNASVGKVGLYKGDFEQALIGTSLTCFRTDHLKMNPAFLACALRGANFQAQLYQNMGQTTRNQVPITAQKKLTLPLPPIKLQNQFAERIQLIEAQKQQAQASLEKSEALFNSLLQRAFTGELTAKMAA